MPEWMRPDKAHVMIEKLPNVPVVLALAEPGYEKVWRTAKVVAVLRNNFQLRGIAVVASDKLALLPENRTVKDVMRDVMTVARSMGH
jgi:hypothetical protein